jgi:hypothetical protein
MDFISKIPSRDKSSFRGKTLRENSSQRRSSGRRQSSTRRQRRSSGRLSSGRQNEKIQERKRQVLGEIRELRDFFRNDRIINSLKKHELMYYENQIATLSKECRHLVKATIRDDDNFCNELLPLLREIQHKIVTL